MGDKTRLSADSGKLRVINRVLTTVPPQIRIHYSTKTDAENAALNVTANQVLVNLHL